MRHLSLVALLLMAACAPAQRADVGMARPNADLSTASSLGAAGTGTAVNGARATAPQRSNAEIAQDYLDLVFTMESGRVIPRFSRFEGPITVSLTGDVPQSAAADLDRLISRFRSEVGLNIETTRPGIAASITVEFLPRSTMQRVVPSAACFVVPRVASWEDYRARKGTPDLDWTTVRQRTQVAIFVPSDTTPQEVRDCLHEEIAQSLGPLNDLYRLPDSVFNDDNFHNVLTGFDMLVLRMHYSADLQIGMTRQDVAKRLPALLARVNPAGERSGATPGQLSPRTWIAAIEGALGRAGSAGARAAAAERAVSIAQAQGWQDNRLAFSYFALGRVSVANDTARAVTAFAEAARLYRGLPGGAIHAAHVDMQMAAFALSSNQPDQVLALTDRAIPVVRQAENAALLATLMLLRAQALDDLGRTDEANALRLDTAPWARYGFGADAQIRARTQEIASLASRG
jgi:Protein of unknown function (DUF2927)